MDLDDTLEAGVATEMSTGAKLLLHRISKGEVYAAMKTITQYLKETYPEAFRDIHAINQDAATTKLVGALWAPIGDAANSPPWLTTRHRTRGTTVAILPTRRGGHRQWISENSSTL